MHIVHVVAGIWEHTGGPAEVIPKLCQALVRQGCDITLMTLDGPHSQATFDCSINGVELRSFPVIGRSGIWYSPKLSKALKQIADKCDIIHNHGMWLHPNWCATKWAKANDKPLVISPHGVLTPGMLQRSRLKKLIAWALFDRRSVKYASVIQTFTEAEREQMEPRIRGKNVAVIPNGVDLWDLPDRGAFETRYPQTCGKKILLFLARVHPIKGVFDLVDAWKILGKRYPKWHLIIVGRPEAECIDRLNARVKEHNLTAPITVTGPQYGQKRLEAYAAASAFVLPSYAEGFSTSILEAMACRLPVVYTYTDPCNFSEAAERGAGIVGPAGTEPLIRNLERLFQLSDVERTRMGAVGRTLIQEKYTWPQVAKRMKQTYDWILGGVSTPPWVEVV